MAKQEYIQKNREWLSAKAKEPGVMSLDKGIYYKVIKKGNPKGAMPNRGSVVTAHYVGKTINGKTFDSSRGGVAPAFRLRELIPGWVIALQQMHVGDITGTISLFGRNIQFPFIPDMHLLQGNDPSGNQLPLSDCVS